MAANVYVDTTHVGGAENGSITDPWHHWEDINNGDIDGNTVVHVAGDNYLTSVSALFGRNGNVGDPIIVKQWEGRAQNRLIAGIDCNDPAYSWVGPDGSGEYRLELSGGGDPALNEAKSGTVDGYYRGSSVSTTNQALEQRARDVAVGNAPVIGSMPDMCWGWGDNGGGFDTIVFKPESGKTPSDYVIEVSQNSEVINVTWGNYRFEKMVFNLANGTNVQAGGVNWEFAGNIFSNADFTALKQNTTGNMYASGNIFSQSHRAVELNKDGTSDIFNNIGHNNHLFLLIPAGRTAASVTSLKNNIAIGGESGFIDDKSGSTTLTEENNLMYLRCNDGNDNLAYINPANWPLTDASSYPASVDNTTTAASAAGQIDPDFTAYNNHNYLTCDFNIFDTSLASANGQYIADAVDFDLQPLNPSSPNIGIYSVSQSTGSPTLTTPYSIGTNNGPLFTIKTSDTLATIEGAGFFNDNAGYASLLKTGDVVLIEASNGTKLYNVTVDKTSRIITLSTGTEIA